MAKAYKAVTRIEHGETKDGENRTKVFEPGDVVRGLSTEVMKNLWDNGALQAVDVVEVEKSSDANASEEGDRNVGPKREPQQPRQPESTG